MNTKSLYKLDKKWKREKIDMYGKAAQRVKLLIITTKLYLES